MDNMVDKWVGLGIIKKNNNGRGRCHAGESPLRIGRDSGEVIIPLKWWEIHEKDIILSAI